MESRNSKHSRSKSDLVMKFFKDENFSGKRKATHLHKMEVGEFNGSVQERKFHHSDVQTSLQQEIMQLQEQLHCQFVVRQALEKAISHKLLSKDVRTMKNSIPKAAMELINDIAILELEIVYLEQNLLSLYRKTYFQQVSSSSAMDLRPKLASDSPDGIMQEKDNLDHSGFLHQNSSNGSLEPDKIFDFDADSTCSIINTYHSLPLSMLEWCFKFEKYIPTAVKETPNSISEKMIKCISAIYYELAEPPLIHYHSSSPISFSSSVYELSSQDHVGFKIPKISRHDNPFHTRESIRTYSKMLKVNWISRESQRLKDIEHMLQNYRSVAYRLEEIDPTRMKYREKLAFWINVHNSLVMHALLVHGIPKNNLKRISFLLKASFNIGGQIISINSIQSSILGLHLPRPGQWLKLLFPLKSKLKMSDAVKGYEVERPEPLLYFALCSGNESDPAVRIYTAKGVFEELEAAKEEYIQSTFSIHKEQTILLPKIINAFAKDLGLSTADLAKTVDDLSPNMGRKSRQHCQNKKLEKGIDWIPHSFNFQFLLSKSLFKF